MSRVVVIEKNKEGKVELAMVELQKMLDDAYNQGYADGKVRYETITVPSNPHSYDYKTTCDSAKANLSDSTKC